MKAVVYRRYGGPEVLEPAELPEPKTHVDSVLVRVRAAGLNHADLAMQAGLLDAAVETYFPVVPGWDIAGVVQRAGPGAAEFSPGDEVIGYLRGDVQRAHGGLAELAAADVRTLARKPAGMDFAEAAALPLAGLTAYQGVVRALGVRAGETLLVLGAAGGVGSLAVQIALVQGARVIGSAAPGQHDYLRSLGAEAAGRDEALARQVRQVVPQGADAVFDTAGHGGLRAAAGAARPGGRLASAAEPGVPGATDVFARLDAADLTAVAALAAAGRLRVRVGATFGLDQAADAERALAAGKTPGKIVVQVS
jgi:NADPH:quinone reductase-like Zn-dependent oxidoreductase